MKEVTDEDNGAKKETSRSNAEKKLPPKRNKKSLNKPNKPSTISTRTTTIRRKKQLPRQGIASDPPDANLQERGAGVFGGEG
jgi:hypothetical protein